MYSTGVDHRLVGQVGAATLRGAYSALALEPLQRRAWSGVSAPCAMRGAQAAWSPIFGAPAMPAPWQATQAWLYTVSPGRSSTATAGRPSAGARAELSWPATATFATGLIRAATSCR